MTSAAVRLIKCASIKAEQAQISCWNNQFNISANARTLPALIYIRRHCCCAAKRRQDRIFDHTMGHAQEVTHCNRGCHLISEDSQAFLESELEPVTARHSVTSPVVEVLMAHNSLDPGKVHVGCSLWGRQHQAAVEDVEGLVLHGSHVEVIHGHNVEQVQVILQSKGVLHHMDTSDCASQLLSLEVCIMTVVA